MKTEKNINEDLINKLYTNDLKKLKYDNKNQKLMELEKKKNEFDPNLRKYSNTEYLKKKKEIEDRYKISNCNKNKRINISTRNDMETSKRKRKAPVNKIETKQQEKKNLNLNKSKLYKDEGKRNIIIQLEENLKSNNNEEKAPKNCVDDKKIEKCNDFEYYSDNGYDNLKINNQIQIELPSNKINIYKRKSNKISKTEDISLNQQEQEKENEKDYYLNLRHNSK